RRLLDANGQRVFTPSPETDRNPVAAAARFYAIESSAELRDAALLHDDAELLEEALAVGDAIRGRIVEVRDEGEGRKTRPVWAIAADGNSPVRFREGSSVCVHGLPGRQGRIRSLLSDQRGVRLEIEITKLPTKPRGNPAGVRVAADPALRGTSVTLVKAIADGIGLLKRQKVWVRGTPGAWLTGGRGAELDTAPETVDPAAEATLGVE